MKMTAQHYNIIAAQLPRETHYRSAYQGAGLSFTRYAFDYFHNRVKDYWIKELYAYLNDANIETALRKHLDVRAYERGE